jgi:hypothetical protein
MWIVWDIPSPFVSLLHQRNAMFSGGFQQILLQGFAHCSKINGWFINIFASTYHTLGSVQNRIRTELSGGEIPVAASYRDTSILTFGCRVPLKIIIVKKAKPYIDHVLNNWTSPLNLFIKYCNIFSTLYNVGYEDKLLSLSLFLNRADQCHNKCDKFTCVPSFETKVW